MTTNNNRSMRITRLGLKLGWCALIGATGLLLTASAMARAESVRFDIPIQPLPAALRVFAAQAQMQLLYEQGAVASASGNAVIGEFDKQAALAQLLRNTGLEVVYSSESTATIRPASDKQTEQKITTDAHAPVPLRLAEVAQPRKRDSSVELAKSSLEEVIVTARRREENIQTVPVAITVVSQEALQENNVQTLGDLQYMVPSMSATTGLTRDALNLSIRGQGTNGISGLPAVIVYINEVPVPTDKDSNIVGGPGLLFDLENVQVLKGPQGTLFGRNTTGGALLLQTKRPSNEFGGRIQLTGGNYSDREVDGAVDLPIVHDKLLTRVAFTGQKRDGFTKLLSEPGHPNGIDADNRDFWSARGTVTFRPADSFENDTIVTYTKYDSNGAPVLLTDLNPTGVISFLYPAIPAQFAEQQSLGIRTAIPIDTHLESSGSTLSINNISRFALTNEVTLRNIFGYTESKTSYAFDLDATSNPILNIPNTPRNQTIRQYTDELQVLGKNLDGRLDWIVGGFFLKQNPPSTYVLQTSLILAGTPFGGPSDSEYRQGDKSEAIFGQATYAITPKLKFTAGGRYTWDERFFNTRGGNTFPVVCTEPRVNCTDTTMTESKGSAFTWTLGLDYQVSRETLLYLASRRGYRAGGVNLGTFNGVRLPFDPEYVTDVEIGTKSDWNLGNVPVRTNVAIYYQDYSDIQVSQTLIDNQNFPVGITANAATARVYGAEFEALLQLTENLQIGANFDYLHFEYTEFQPGVLHTDLLEAQTTVNRPPRKYGVSARYHLPVPLTIGDISIQANWNWQDESGDTSQPGGIIDAFGVLNAVINWNEIAGSHIDTSAFVSNATDKEYNAGPVALYNNLGYSAARYGEPRMYGLRLRYRFGGE